MKFVSTAVPYRAVVVERDEDGAPTRTVSNVPLKVSDADAASYVKLGDELGVQIVETDADEDTPVTTVTQVTPDLSAGAGALTGQGDPVTNDQAQGKVPAKSKEK